MSGYKGTQMVATLENQLLNPLCLDHEGLLAYQKNRPPYLLVDRADEIIPGKSAKGFKRMYEDLWFFDCHFPGDPNMPGMLQAEALVQLAALTVLTLPGNKGKIVYLTSVNKMRLRRKVIPGDCFRMSTELQSWRRGMGVCHGRGTVEDEVACDVEFSFVMPEAIQEFKPKS